MTEPVLHVAAGDGLGDFYVRGVSYEDAVAFALDNHDPLDVSVIHRNYEGAHEPLDAACWCEPLVVRGVAPSLEEALALLERCSG